MSIFRCEKCGCVENTATSDYWSRAHPFDGSKPKPVLCSECDPEIGKWHGRFPKNQASGFCIGDDGFLYHPDEVSAGQVKHTKTKIVGKVPGELVDLPKTVQKMPEELEGSSCGDEE